MSTDNRRIDDLVAAVAEGRTVDWPTLLNACESDGDRRLVEQLKVLSDVARTANAVPAPSVLFRWGQLEVLEELGHGAFGRVFRARDPRLDREVALKLFDHSQIGHGRLVREAQRLARIRHPHVVVVHGADAIDGRVGLWMELVRGRTLHDVVHTDGPFGPREATMIGLDLCRALAAVHAARLLHGDIKSTNVMRETGGRIVLMDFGAGVHRDTGDRGDDPATGTPLYMAPELLEGGEATIGTDLYALGVLLFHSITGAYPVRGASIAGLREHHARQARMLLRDARPDVPAALGQVVDRALSHSPADRFRSAADMERALAATLDVERAAPLDSSILWWRRWTTSWRAAMAALVAISLVIAATVFVASELAGLTAGNVTLSPETIAFAVEPPEGSSFAHGLLPAVSPDGSRIAFATATTHTSSTLPQRLWMRRLESLAAEPIPGTETGNQPFWSPDSRFVAFSARDGVLKRTDVSGGFVITLADWGLGGSWNAGGVVLFTGRDGRIYRVHQDGGETAAVTTLEAARSEARHLWPSFLPDGRRFLFMAESSSGGCVLYVGSLDSSIRTQVANIASKADYAGGFLYYQREGTLVAQPFELESARLTGEARPIATSLRAPGSGRASFSVSGNGVVVYATHAGGPETNWLTWFDASGKRLAAVGQGGNYAYPSLSPDGSRLATFRLTAERLWDIWTVDLVRNVPTRFTFGNEVTFLPVVWSPDGQLLIYPSQGESRKVFNLYQRSLTGAARDDKLRDSEDDEEPTAVSSDGRILLFNRERGTGRGTDVWALPLTGASRVAYPVLDAKDDEESAVFSPDGRWIAYSSNESGVFQVYVQPFPATGLNKIQISSDGGLWPRWTSDGRIFYSTEDRIWSVDVHVSGGTLHAGVPRALFSQKFLGYRWGGFAVDQTGNRFLLVVPEEGVAPSLKVLVNPLADLRLRR